MKPVAWMVAASLLSWVGIAAAVEPRTRAAALFGMLGPLVVAASSWVMAERAWRRNPESLTSWMIAAFAGKMVFFAAYVAVMLKALSPSTSSRCTCSRRCRCGRCSRAMGCRERKGSKDRKDSLRPLPSLRSS